MADRQKDSPVRAMNHFVPSSGGKDSTTLLLHLWEIEPEGIQPVITPTGDELPEMEDHWARLEEMTKPFIRLPCPSLMELIEKFSALPNWRQRWCTRLIKIVPFEAFILRQQSPCMINVGLRADEPDEVRSGMEMEPNPNIKQRWSLREWGWGINEVIDYLKRRNIIVPARTDCGCCFFQRIHEWFELWERHPDRWRHYEGLEVKIGHTFRSPGRDTWPASLEGMRKEFERGRRPLVRGSKKHCRVCSL